MIKPKLFFNNRLRDAQKGDDGTSYATCAEAVVDPDDPFKVRGDIQPAQDIPNLAALKGSGITFDTTTNKYRIVDTAQALRRLSSLGLVPAMGYDRTLIVNDSYLYVACNSTPVVVIKIDLTTFAVVDSMILESGENSATSLAVYGYNLYVCCDVSPVKIVKINLTTFSRTNALTLNAGEIGAKCLAVYGSDLYIGCNLSPAVIVKADLGTFTRTSALTLNAGENGVYSLAVYGSDLYVGCSAVSPAIIVKINLGLFTRTSALTLNAGENSASCLAVYGSDLYVGCYVSPSIIVKINLSTFTRTGAITLNAGENLAWSLAVYGSYLYVGCELSPAIIVKVNLGTFTRTGAVTLNAGENNAYSLAVYGSDLYVGCYVSPSIIVKLDLTTFTRTTALTLSDGEPGIYALAIYGSDLYATCDASPAKIVKIDLSTFTRTDVLTLNAGEDDAYVLAIYGSYLYVCCYVSPTIIVKIDLSTFTRIGSLTLNAGENSGRALAVYGSDLYVGCSVVPSIIVKVNLGTFTRTTALTLNAGENSAKSLIVYGTDLYVGCRVSPTIIVKVNLSTFTRTGALTLNAGENLVESFAVYGSDLYVGCYVSPSIVVKVALGTFTRTGALTLDAGENLARALVVYGSDLYVGCSVSPSIIVKIALGTFSRIGALTLDSGENLLQAMAVYNTHIYIGDYTPPAAMIQKLDPLAYFQLFERLQTQDIGDSFTVRAGLTCATADSTRPVMYAADGHVSPRFKGTENTELKLYAHAPNLLADGGLESGAYSPNWTAGGANWTIESSSPLVGAYSAKCDFSTNDTLIQSITTKIKKTKTYRLIFMADSLTAAISAGALTITLRQAGSNTPIDADITGTQPVITTDAAWFEIEFTPDFTTNNWQIVLTPNMGLKGSSTGILLDEFYIYEKQTHNSLWVDGHNWAGKGRVMIKPRRYSGLRSTAHPDSAFSRASVAYDSDGNSHASGIPRYETGADSTTNGAILIEEGTTNLLTTNQASVETDTTGFFAFAASLSRVTTEYWHGAAALRIITDNAGTDEGFQTTYISVSDSLPYTVSVWLKGSGTVTLRLREADAGVGVVGDTESDVITLTSEWQHYSVSRTFGATGVYASLMVRTDVQQGITFYADGLQIEQKSYATSWQLPSDGARAAENFTLDPRGFLTASQGSIAFWAYITAGTKPTGATAQFFWHSTSGNQNRISIGYSAGSWYAASGNSGGTTSTATKSDAALTGWHHFVMIWNSNELQIYVDGIAGTAASSPNIPSIIHTSACVGHQTGPINYCNARLDNFQIFNTVLTSAEIAALYATFDPRTLASYASCTWHQDFDSGYDSGGFLVDTSERFLMHIPTSDWPVVELTLPAVASWTAEAGEIYIGDYWQLPRYPQPMDPYATDEGGRREFSLNFSLIPAQYRTSQIEALFDRLRSNEPVLVQWDTDDPILTEARTRARKASYDPYRIDLPLEFIERL